MPHSPLYESGPAAVYWAGIYIGDTKGVVFKDAPDYTEIMIDQHGKNPYDEIGNGAVRVAEFSLAIPTLAEIVAMMPAGTLGTSATATQIMVKSNVGISLRDTADTMIFKPYINCVASTDEATWLNVALCTPRPDDQEYVYDSENSQRVYKFKAVSYVVVAADIATDGALYNGGTPLWAVGESFAIGLNSPGV